MSAAVMPASLFADMSSSSPALNGGPAGCSLEDQRALQLALELSMLGLTADDDAGLPFNTANSNTFEDLQNKRSVNMTECVPVPSSEHVAEIVGRQGCKIKALRAKTNTYIKTPVRGEEPVFVVTGRKEDVCAAKREILSAAEHFSQIRASRRNSSVSNGSGTSLTPGPPSPNAPGQVTIQVRVPYRVVGLVVGPKGATIKRIQQQTHTYIVTPSRDKEPVFEVTGLPENVEKARQEIESHIAMRTGGLVEPQDENDFHVNGIDSGFQELNGEMMFYKPTSVAANNFYNSNNLSSSRLRNDASIFSFPPVNGTTKMTDFNLNPLANGFSALNSLNIYDNDEGIGSPSFEPIPPSPSLWPDLSNSTGSNLVSSLFGAVTTAASLPRRSSSLGNSICTSRLSPTSTDSNDYMNCNGNSSTSSSSSNSTNANTNGALPNDHSMVRRIRSDPLANGLVSLTSAFTPFTSSFQSSTSPDCTNLNSISPILTNGFTSHSLHNAVHSSSPTSCDGSDHLTNGSSSPISDRMALSNGGTVSPRRHCMICSQGDVVAALVPCGHNLFCMECANHVMDQPTDERQCPVCQQMPTQAIRIFS